MKKFLLAIIVAASFAVAFPAAAQEKPVDLIVLLDASQSMFPYFTEVVDFVVSRIAREYLRFGDTFHLLTFTDSVRIEIAQSVRTEQDIKSLLGRLYLLYPFGRSTDLVSALSALYRYTADLPESNRKLIIMVTDGMHNPSAQSPNAGLDVEQVRSSIDETASRIRANGWTIRIVRVPFGAAGALAGGDPGPGGSAVTESPGTSPGAGDYLSDVAVGLGAPVTDFTLDGREDAAGRSVEIPRVIFPGHLGRRGYDFTFPLAISNPSDRDLRLELTGVHILGRNSLRKSLFVDIPTGGEKTIQIPVRLSDEIKPGQVSLEAELRFANGMRVVPTVGILSLDLEYKPLARVFRSTGTAVLFLVLLFLALVLIIALVVYVRGLHRRAEGSVVEAVFDSEAAAADERRRALASARRPSLARVTKEESLSYGSDLVPRHVSDDEAREFEGDLKPQHITAEEAEAFKSTRKPITAEEARSYSDSRALTEEEAAKYRDHTSRSAAETLAAFAADNSPNRQLPTTAAVRSSEYVPVIKRTGSLRVEFRVEDQNPCVGLRNVRTLHSGGKKTIGGKRSDFLIFMVPVPARVAEVHFDGEDLTIVPLRPEYFPDYSGPISGCLESPVRMVNRYGKELTLSFGRYVPPADRLNRILHCVDAPGIFAVNGVEPGEKGSA